MKPLLALLALLASVSCGLALTACGGGTSKGADSASGSSGTATTSAAEGTATTSAAEGTGTAPAQTLRGLKGDEDDDDGAGESPTMSSKSPTDADIDNDNDSKDNTSSGYFDKDDVSALRYGRVPAAGDERTLTELVKRYYAAAAAQDGGKACAMIDPSFARTIPEDYGQPPGPVYLRGKSCPAVMTLLFRHERGQLASPVKVTDVRVQGSQALVLLGSSVMPASEVTLKRRGGGWKIVGLLAAPLP